MSEVLPVQRVEVGFVSAPPAGRIARAAGVSDVEIDGSVLRCVVFGSFQPFLEALRGYEVTTLQVVPAAPRRWIGPIDTHGGTRVMERNTARIAGLLYLVVAVGGAFGLAVRGRIVKAGDAAATADNIRASAGLFRAGLLSNLVASVFLVFTAMALYVLFRQVHRMAAGAMVTTAAIGAAAGCLNLVNWYTALTVATGERYAGTFGRAGADTLATLYLDAENNGSQIAFVFFGLWLVPLGYLVIRSGFVPRLLGIALIVGCFGYLAGVGVRMLGLDVPAGVLLALGAVGGLPELALVTWLLVRGGRSPARGAPTPAVADARA
jgi:hypothetical protein